MFLKLPSFLRPLFPQFVLYGCCGGGGIDTGPIAAASEKAAILAKQAADDDLAFRQDQYADLEPYLRSSLDIGNQMSQQQIALAQQAADRSTEQWDYYKDTFQPVERQMVQEAMDYGSAADQEQQAGTARADMTAAFDSQRQQANRQLMSMGVNPNSGKFAASNRAADIAQAAATAGAMTGARTTARDKGISLRAGAAAFGRNMTNTAGQNLGQAVGAGTAATGAANSGIGSNLAASQYVSGGYGMQMNAANTQLSAANTQLGAMQLSAQMDMANSSGWGSLLGSAMGAGAMLL